MKLSDINYVLKRYKYIMKHKTDETAVTFYVGNRKEKVDLDEEFECLMEIIEDVINSESGESKKILLLWIVKGKNDVNILSKANLSRSSYYKEKLTKKYKIYCLCACKGLLSYEEILKEM